MFGDIPLVLQQGEHKIPMVPGGVTKLPAYLAEKQAGIGQYTPLSLAEIQKIADGLKRDVPIRTREIGEIVYNGGISCESDRSRRASRKR